MASTKTDAAHAASLSDLAGTYPDATAELFSKTNNNAATLATTNSDIQKGSKEVDSKIKAISSNSADAISSPVSFVTKPIDDAVKTTTSTGGNTVDSLAGMDKKEISDVSKATGITIDSSSSYNTAINNSNNSLRSNISTDLTSIQSTKVNTISPTVSDDRDYNSSLLSSIKSSLGDVTTNETVSSVLGEDTVNDLVDEILPASVKTYLKTEDANSSGLTADIAQGIDTAISSLSDGGDTSGIFTALVGMTGDTYPKLANEIGEPLTSIFGDNNGSLVNTLYTFARSICNNITAPGYYNYRQNKDLYDLLMWLAARLGLSDLIRQLRECANSDGYFDIRSISSMQQIIRSVAVMGDPHTYSAIASTIGKENVVEPSKDMTILAANMLASNENMTAYDGLLSDFNIDKKDLISSSEYGRTMTSGVNSVFMSHTDDSIVDSQLGSDTRKLVSGAFYSYA